jgi:hypothetical protein
MHQITLNKTIMAEILLLLRTGDRHHWEKMYHLFQQHPSLNLNRNHRYPDELFREGTQEAWATFSQAQIQKILSRCEMRGIEICLENADRLVPELVKHLNTVIRNKTIDIWRKETYLVA